MNDEPKHSISTTPTGEEVILLTYKEGTEAKIITEFEVAGTLPLLTIKTLMTDTGELIAMQLTRRPKNDI